MARIEGIRIRNFRVLKDVTLGRLWGPGRGEPLTALVAVIGKNGVGKSTLFDAFGFLSDCLSFGVEEACDQRGRGGYERLVSSGSRGPIQFDIYFRSNPSDRPLTYELSIGLDAGGRPHAASERMRQSREARRRGQLYTFLDLKAGIGQAWKSQGHEGDESERVAVELTDPRQLGIASLGAFREHPRIALFRQFIESWCLSYFTPDAARSLPMAGPQKHLSIHGDNLANVVQFMEREYKERFRYVLDSIAGKIPGVEKIRTASSPDGGLLLQFNDRGFKDPFYAQQMSDGTLKLFTYLLLLEDPDPPPFICIEEPGNGLYHKLLESLASEFRAHTDGRENAPQILVTTHQPYFVDALEPAETWVLGKQENGFSVVRRASDYPIVKAMVEEGRPLGSLWYSDYLDDRNGGRR